MLVSIELCIRLNKISSCKFGLLILMHGRYSSPIAVAAFFRWCPAVITLLEVFTISGFTIPNRLMLYCSFSNASSVMARGLYSDPVTLSIGTLSTKSITVLNSLQEIVGKATF